MASREELSSKRISELQQLLEERGLDISGKKSELLERLVKAMGMGSDGASAGAGGETKLPAATAPRQPRLLGTPRGCWLS